MPGRFRRIAAAFLVAVTLVGTALPAVAAPRESEMALKGVDPLADLMFLRPIGIGALAVGTVLFVVPVVPIALITRPDGLGMAFQRMVVAPAKYVWADPLGGH